MWVVMATQGIGIACGLEGVQPPFAGLSFLIKPNAGGA